MQKLDFRNGLLYTTIELTHDNKSITIDNVIVDTGAFHSIFTPDYLELLDVQLSEDDELVKSSGYGGTICSSIRKKIEKISCGDISFGNIKLDFGIIDPNERVNGLLGLDFLKQAGIIIDLVESCIVKKEDYV